MVVATRTKSPPLGELRCSVVGSSTALDEGVRADFRPDIQGLRAVAVLLVIFCHASVVGFESGFIGVDVFFVISGYVITGLLNRQPPRQVFANLRHFYIRRILRIVPAATAVLVSTAVVSFWLLGDNFNPSLLEDIRWATLFSGNLRLINISADYFLVGVDPSLVTHFWSLAVEEQFYFFYPLLVFVLTWVAPLHSRTKALQILLALIITGSAVWSSYLTPLDPVTAYYSPLTRLWELAFGGLLATIPSDIKIRFPRVRTLLAAIAAILLASCLWVITPTSGFPGVIAWLPVSATGVLLWLGQSSVHFGGLRFLSKQPLRYLGDISYSLYLWHYLWLMLPKQLNNGTLEPLMAFGGIVGTLACAAASYHWLENPIRRSSRLRNDGWATLLVLAICLALSLDATVLIEKLVLSQ